MIRLLPRSNYCITYADGTTKRFCTVAIVEEAKLMIRVIPEGETKEVPLVTLLLKEWDKIEKEEEE